jgi:hypothetical protein
MVERQFIANRERTSKSTSTLYVGEDRVKNIGTGQESWPWDLFPVSLCATKSVSLSLLQFAYLQNESILILPREVPMASEKGDHQ